MRFLVKLVDKNGTVNDPNKNVINLQIMIDVQNWYTLLEKHLNRKTSRYVDKLPVYKQD